MSKEILFPLAKAINGWDEAETLKNLFDGEGDKAVPKKNAGALLVASDAARIEKIKTDAAAQKDGTWNDAYKKATGEVLDKAEKKVLTDTGYPNPDDLKGAEMFVAAALWMKDNKALTDAEVKAHPTFLQAENDHATELIKVKDDAKTEVDGYKLQVSKEKIFATIKGKAKVVFLAKNPVLSKDPVKANNQVEDFLGRLQGYDYQILDDGTPVPMKDGVRIEDKHSHPLQFDNFVISQAEPLFDFAKQSQKGNAGNANDGEGDGSGAGGGDSSAFEYEGIKLDKVPTTITERNDMMRGVNNATAAAINKAYEEFKTD